MNLLEDASLSAYLALRCEGVPEENRFCSRLELKIGFFTHTYKLCIFFSSSS